MNLVAPLKRCCYEHVHIQRWVNVAGAARIKAVRPAFIELKSRAFSTFSAAIDDIRNIGIIAHVDAGKTTTTERMLYFSGASRHIGNVDSGDTVTDFLPLEQKKGITIQSAAITFNWPVGRDLADGESPKVINLIDTPGHQDFRFEVDRCLPVLDGAVCILDGVKGVETHTERVWASAQQSRIPRIIFVNKLDRDGASFKRSVLDVATKLGAVPLVCQIPLWSKETEGFLGVIDVINQVGIRWSATGAMTKTTSPLNHGAKEGSSTWLEAQKARESLIEVLCQYDDDLMQQFDQHEWNIRSSEIKKSIRRLIQDGQGAVVPVFAGASRRNMGVQPLLDAVVDYLPSPAERPALQVHSQSQTLPLSDVLSAAARAPGSSPHRSPVGALASVFKVVDDPRRGMLSYVRIYHGTLHKKDSMWNTHEHAFERPLNMLHIAAKESYDVEDLSTGHIGALTGLKEAKTGHTLITFPSKKAPALLESVQIRPPNDIPPAVAFIAINTYSLTEGQKLENALTKASREDPSLRWSKDEKADQYILSGLGELHLEVAKDRLKTHYKVDSSFGQIEIEYKESVTARVESKSAKTACTAKLEPLDQYDRDEHRSSSIERDGNIISINISAPDAKEIPRPEADALRQQLLNGVITALARGPRRGAPITNCHVALTYDFNSDHAAGVAASQVVTAAKNAVKDLLKEADAKNFLGVFEPVMSVRITCPEDAVAAIRHDISSARGGVVLEINDENVNATDNGIDLTQIYVPPDPYDSVQSLRGPKKALARRLEIVAQVPLKEMLGYDASLRSMTGGQHSIHMELSTFSRVVGHREKALDMM